LININIQTILELGCGTGTSIKLLARQFPKAKLVYVDSSELMLQGAKKNKPWFRKVQYMQEDAMNLSLPNNSVDLVISNLMLPSCPEPDNVFKEVQRVTRKNGLFSFTSLGPDSFKELRAAFNAAGVAHDDLAFGHLTDMHDLGDGLIRAGLREPVMDVDYFSLTFSSFAQLWQELERTGNIFQTFGDDDLKAVEACYLKNSQDGSFSITYEVVYGQTWAGDGISKARTPDEVHVPISHIGTRNS
jgi:malonyl-CoA O-methyltransferase